MHTRKHATRRRLARRGHGDALAVKLKKQSVNCLRSRANDTTSHHSRTSSIRFFVLFLQLATVGASAAKKSGQRLNCCIGCEYTHSTLHDRADRGLKRHSVGVRGRWVTARTPTSKLGRPSTEFQSVALRSCHVCTRRAEARSIRMARHADARQGCCSGW